MIWMFDTDILIYFANREPGFENIARRMSGRSPGELRMSVITLSELRFGIENGEFRPDNRRALAQLLNFFQTEDLPCGVAQDFAEIKTALARKGRLIGPYDMLIAAHARHIAATW